MSTTGKDIETILKESIPGLTSGMQGMANRLTENDGFYGILDQAFKDLDSAVNEFAKDLEELELDTTYNNIAKNIGIIIDATDPMLTAITSQFEALKPLLERVQAIETAWAGALANAKALAGESYEDVGNGTGNNYGGNGNTITDPDQIDTSSLRWTNYNYKDIDQELINKYNIMSQEEFQKSLISGDLSGQNINAASKNEANQYSDYQAYLDDKYYQAFNKSSIDEYGRETYSYDASRILTANSPTGQGEYFYLNGKLWTDTPGVGKHPIYTEMQATSSYLQNFDSYVTPAETQSGYIPVAYSSGTQNPYLFDKTKMLGMMFEIIDPRIYENGHDKYVRAKLINDAFNKATTTISESIQFIPINALDSVDFAHLGWSKDIVQAFDTGGYTGVWNSSEGRMAMLHEKELILNKMDTANILSAVSMVRDIASALTTSVNLHIADKMSRILSASDFEQAEATPMEQKVYIEAHFPSANNAKEIEEAFDNLVLRATQSALKNPNR